MHRQLDAAGKDKITTEERLAVLDHVFHPEVTALMRRTLAGPTHRKQTELNLVIDSNAIWHGRVNPRGWAVRRVEDMRPEAGPGVATRYERYGTISIRPGGRR
jgi:regulator of protease activity HflC (stomatin/prohibitin superfamily)